MSRRVSRFIGAVAVLVFASVVNAGMVEVELIPADPGPYYGGESLTVDVWLHSQYEHDVRIDREQLDFSGTSANLLLDDAFTFDFGSLGDPHYYQALHPELPVPWAANSVDCFCPERFLLLPGDGQLHIGSLGIELPVEVGAYGLDALNALDPDLGHGGSLGLRYSEPETFWRAYTGEILGGTLEFVVVPEPSLLLLLGLGGLALFPRGRNACRKDPRTLGTTRGSVRGRWTRALPCLCAACSTAWSSVLAEPLFLPAVSADVTVTSGPVSATGPTARPRVVYSEVISYPNAAWIRLHFDSPLLSEGPDGRNRSFLRVSSLEDDADQILDAHGLALWRNSSGAFNGERVLVELFAYPNTGASHVAVGRVHVAVRVPNADRAQECEIDDRIRSADPRSGRLSYFNGVEQWIEVCTAFLVNHGSNSLLTAGHCCAVMDFDEEEIPPIVEFHVPTSLPDGTLRSSDPEDQYPLDPASLQFQDLGVANDWCFFGAFDSTETGLSPFEAQQSTYRLASAAPTADGSLLLITGYGRDDGVDNVIEQTAAGSYLTLFGDELRYDVFTEPGDSGAPVEHLCRGLTYGIHAHGACSPLHDYNQGTAVNHAALADALVPNWIDGGIREPLGICAQPRDCNGNGIEDYCDVTCSAPGCTPPCATSDDCNSNYIPDECEDCNNNGIGDSCDVDQGTSPDVNDNHVPDECEPDCNSNGIPDGCDIASGQSEDCTLNGIPDECDPNCNHNFFPDPCEILSGFATDCNGNWIPDECEGLRLYVDQSAIRGTNDGSSWENAYLELRSALAHVDPCEITVTEIWVAQGEYKPAVCDPAPCDAASPERAESFVIPQGVSVYGGFPAGGGTFAARAPWEHITTLSGDLNGVHPISGGALE
jgi:V8-like Glu-specific endopeptidase